VQPGFVEKWKSIRELANGKKIVGLNTGCGKRWVTRMWETENWVQLIQMESGLVVVKIH
jgi:heptosyltransferase-2